jgi:hypothetical protein
MFYAKFENECKNTFIKIASIEIFKCGYNNIIVVLVIMFVELFQNQKVKKAFALKGSIRFAYQLKEPRCKNPH